MQQKKNNKKRIITYACIAAAAALLIAIFVFGVFGRSGADEAEESIRAIKNAVTEKALQCYVIEGAYPSELSYLEDNYGLIVNKNDYYIVYRAVGENISPYVEVVAKGRTDE